MAALSKTAPIGALFLLAGAAQAEVTAEQVWQDWQEGARRLGETRIETGAEDRAGDTLTITDLVLTMQGEDGTLIARLPRIVFTETGDGTVEIGMSDSYPIIITGTDEAGFESEIDLSVRQTGLALTVSGDPDAMRYDYTASRYALTLNEITEAGEMVPAEGLFALNALSGSYLAQTGADGCAAPATTSPPRRWRSRWRARTPKPAARFRSMPALPRSPSTAPCLCPRAWMRPRRCPRASRSPSTMPPGRPWWSSTEKARRAAPPAPRAPVRAR